MRIAVFGGSFNPFHIGHAMLADTIVKELGYDKVLIVPTFIPPHKIISCNVTPQQRLEMVKVFCDAEGSGHFEMEPCEVERGGVSYTTDTLKFLKEKYKGKIDGKFAFVMGEEIATQFHRWRDPDGVIENADLIITPRYPDWGTIEASAAKNKPAGDYQKDFNEKFNPDTFGYPCTLLEKPMLPVSSTEIRRRVQEGKSFRYLVPEVIFEYILKNRIYLNK